MIIINTGRMDHSVLTITHLLFRCSRSFIPSQFFIKVAIDTSAESTCVLILANRYFMYLKSVLIEWYFIFIKQSSPSIEISGEISSF